MILLIGTVQSMADLKPAICDVNHKLKRTSAGRADPDVYLKRTLRRTSNGVGTGLLVSVGNHVD
jgi:hypothetical protein